MTTMVTAAIMYTDEYDVPELVVGAVDDVWEGDGIVDDKVDVAAYEPMAYMLWSYDPMYRIPFATAGEAYKVPPVWYVHIRLPVVASNAYVLLSYEVT